jgi:Pyruvate/2-oxoacid:ferredoxin oxidoreductase delta subunit
MARAEIVLDEKYCTGCGYCEIFCPEGCIRFIDNRLSAGGYSLPTLIDAESCKGCGICALMCPSLAIEVYVIVSKKG